MTLPLLLLWRSYKLLRCSDSDICGTWYVVDLRARTDLTKLTRRGMHTCHVDLCITHNGLQIVYTESVLIEPCVHTQHPVPG